MISAFRIEDTSASHVGHVRSENEDSHFGDAEAGVWIVADGMGGHANGKLASEALAHAVQSASYPESLDEACAAVAGAIHLANRAIHEHAQEHGVQMGSTAVALVIRGDEFAVLWAGDSRAYLFRQGELILLTRDHTQVQEMVDRGLLSEEEAADHPMKHVLSRAVGVEETLEIDAIRDQLQSRDLFILCSDGLYGMVDEARIAAILQDHGPVASEALIAESLERGATDNVTVTVIGVSEPTLLALNGGLT
ncbi:MAG TPA: protein phosphatase 2C domain-containing protein [Novosphingobium sp.]|nr:protein phosphatase 2C domain-containing protein [Novosphingobium sp.]HMP55020.1 protein phosphatase 2C domain-containing protein [Novosphingobium sp.]